MADTDIRAARDRIETVEKRIAAMHDAGVDVAALRAQLAFAHHALREGRLADIEAICDEVLGAARRLAELGSRASQVRTPAYGTPVHQPTPAHPPASPSREPSTEALQRVKVGRAQLADEVRAVIEAEVRTQIHPPVDPAIVMAPMLSRLEALESQLAVPPAAAPPDLSPLLDRLDALEGRIASAQAPQPAPDLSPLVERLDALEGRIAAGDAQSQVLEQLRAVESRLTELSGRSQTDPALVAGLQHLDGRLAALEARPAAAIDEAAIGAIVRRTVDDVVPKQASELLREAISKLPTRDDLQQIAETLRADLDWRLEKAAAEHGWCSLSDVQTTVRKSMAENDPGSGGSHLGRLEIAMAEFVQQSKEQQDRLIAALAERVVNHTKSLTKRMLVRDPTPPAKPHHETEELSPSFSPGEDGSSRMAAITSVARENQPSKNPTELALDPVPPEILDASRRQHGDTTLFTKRVEVQQPEMPSEVSTEKQPDLRDLVTAEVERALQGGGASTMTAAPMTGEGSSSAALPIAGSGSRIAASPMAEAAAAPPIGSPPADLPVLIAAEVGRQLAMTVPVHLPPSDSDLARAIARALPQALQDDAVRTELFAVLALEAAGKPGVLGEMTGLRRYLKRELQLAAERLGQPVT